ncbi:STAS domain-containing protein [Streptomyces goshikiensis]|uniref:STAS domain-containing protein n=1 Tax=Streptomyces goshikiensis TaxID=1942 RepID=UPI002E1136DA|nr:STAS domain-containing protein [Streptomyces goshikiensis]
MQTPALTIEVNSQPGHTTITLTGELDLDTNPLVTQATDPIALARHTLTLDLTGVTFIDSTGLTMLLRLRQRVNAEAGHLELHGARDQALNLFELTGTHTLFTHRTNSAI